MLSRCFASGRRVSWARGTPEFFSSHIFYLNRDRKAQSSLCSITSTPDGALAAESPMAIRRGTHITFLPRDYSPGELLFPPRLRLLVPIVLAVLLFCFNPVPTALFVFPRRASAPSLLGLLVLSMPPLFGRRLSFGGLTVPHYLHSASRFFWASPIS